MSEALKIAAIILAAGGGTRLGGGKLGLHWQGRPLLAHVLDRILALPALSQTILVLGHNADTLLDALRHSSPLNEIPSLRIAMNPAWRDGQSTSLRCGLDALNPLPEAILILLGDQPLVRPQTLKLLISAYQQSRFQPSAPLAVAPVYSGRRGNPVLLSHTLFPSIMALRGDIGARNILNTLGSRLLLLPVDDPGVVHDVDTPEDYRALKNR